MASKIFDFPDPFGPMIPVKSVNGPITCPRVSLLAAPLKDLKFLTSIDTNLSLKSSLPYFAGKIDICDFLNFFDYIFAT